MATAQTIDNFLTALTAISVPSGVTVSVSGFGKTDDLNIYFTPSFTGVFSITAGDYCNGVSASGVTATLGSVYALTGIDGSKFRQNDGTVAISSTTSGTMYTWSRGL